MRRRCPLAIVIYRFLALETRNVNRLQHGSMWVVVAMTIRQEIWPRAPIGASARRSARREADARAEIRTGRGKHGFSGDGRGKLTNNKIKAKGFKYEACCKVPRLAGLRLADSFVFRSCISSKR